jgi:hypothetical protein
MNAPQNETRPESPNLRDEQLGDIPNGLIKNAVPVGTFRRKGLVENNIQT